MSATTASTFLGEPVGVLIRRVDPSRPADAAGLAAEDIITAIDGHPIPDLATLQETLAGLQPGARVTVDVLRPDGTRQAVKVTLRSL